MIDAVTANAELNAGVYHSVIFIAFKSASTNMPRMCAVCGKTYSRTIKRSHSMRASIRRLLPNLQYAVFDGQRLKACTRCIKTKAKVTK